MITILYLGRLTLNLICGLLSAFLPTYLSYVFLANELSMSSCSSAIPSIITALTLVAYDKSSTLPSTMSIMIETFGLLCRFLVFLVPLGVDTIITLNKSHRVTQLVFWTSWTPVTLWKVVAVCKVYTRRGNCL